VKACLRSILGSKLGAVQPVTHGYNAVPPRLFHRSPTIARPIKQEAAPKLMMWGGAC